MWLIGNSCSTEYGVQSTERGFSFVELMITSVILLVGLVAIIRGFIIATGAFNTAHNHLSLLTFLDSKMQDIESSIKKDSDLKKLEPQGQFILESRNFAWDLEIKDIEDDYDAELKEQLKEVKLEVSWKEQNHPKNLPLATYLIVKNNE